MPDSSPAVGGDGKGKTSYGVKTKKNYLAQLFYTGFPSLLSLLLSFFPSHPRAPLGRDRERRLGTSQ